MHHVAQPTRLDGADPAFIESLVANQELLVLLYRKMSAVEVRSLTVPRTLVKMSFVTAAAREAFLQLAAGRLGLAASYPCCIYPAETDTEQAATPSCRSRQGLYAHAGQRPFRPLVSVIRLTLLCLQ